MSNQSSDHDETEEREFLDSTDRKEADFYIDEPVQTLQENDSFVSEGAYAQPSGNADDPSVSTEVDSAERKAPDYEPRHQTPSHILFLPNMASRTSEKELAEFAEKLPCKAKKTFMYMSDVAYHGFIECFSVEEGTKNLEHINSNNMEVRGKRVIAEYSRRKSVQDRRTYETRQHVRRERDPHPGRRPQRAVSPLPPMRRRSRSRSPPRGYRPRSPPRDHYPPRRDYRDDYYRREGPPPPARDYRYPSRPYDERPPAYGREYDDSRRSDVYDRRYDSYPPQSRGYPRGPSPVQGPPPPQSRGYPRGPSPVQGPPPQSRGYPAQPVQGYSEVVAPYERHTVYHAPAEAIPAAPTRDPYLAHVPYGAAPVSHPLLSMRPTSIGTGMSIPQPTPAYQYHQYR